MRHQSANTLSVLPSVLSKLLQDIEHKQQQLAQWQAAQGQIQQYAAQTLMPIYRQLQQVFFAQMQQLWLQLSASTWNHAETEQIELKIQALAQRLQHAQTLSHAEQAQVQALIQYYQQAAAHQLAKKQKKRVNSADVRAESEAETTDFSEDHSDYASLREQARQQRLADKHAKATLQMNQSLKMVYLKIAAMIHPDREQDEVQKIVKTELFQQANSAYQAEDLFYLLKLQLQLEQGASVANQPFHAEQEKFYQLALTTQLAAVQKQIDDLIDELVWSDKAKIAVKKAKGQLNIANLYKQIDADVSVIKQQMKAEKQRLSFMGKDSGLAMLLEHGVL